jgi:hypothetical protein
MEEFVNSHSENPTHEQNNQYDNGLPQDMDPDQMQQEMLFQQ